MAGTVTRGEMRRGTLNGTYRKEVGYPFEFVADAADGSYPQTNMINISGWVTAVRVIFGSPSPSGLSVQLADEDGVDLLGGLGSGANAFTGTGKVTLSPPEQFHSQLTLNLSGNTANSAQVRVVLYVM